MDTSSRVNIIGVTDGQVKSLGIIQTFLIPNISHPGFAAELTVVPSSFPIPVDGIIGKDFIKAFTCVLDYLSMKFTIRNGKHSVSLDIIEDGFTPDNFHVIPARCEVIREFKLLNTTPNDQVVNKQQIFPGVFIGSSIVNPKRCFLRVLNTNQRPVDIKKCLTLKTEALDDFHVAQQDESNFPSRCKQLLEVLSRNIPDHAPSDLRKLCEEYSDIFALPGDKHTVNNFYQQSLNLKSNTPIYKKNYRYPHSQKSEIDKQVKEMLQQNIIEPSTSCYNSPIILVPKKSINGEKKYRLCIDFRHVNLQLIPDKFPLPRIDEVLDNLGRARFFSTLDLHSGFWQIPLDERSKDVTSFSTSNGSYRFNVLPFGLNVAPNSFARMMTIAFSGLDPATAFIYLDDVIVIGASPEHHLSNLRKVFNLCRKRNLKLNPNKCQFMKAEVNFLGHRCTDRGILPDNSKFTTISEYPIPTDKDAAKRFVLFCNYYRKFIPNFATIAAPLNNLDKKNVNFVWSQDCQNSFEILKQYLKNPPILQYPNFDRQFTITVDASKYGIGAVLSQVSDLGHDLPIAYASKAFTKSEMNKPTIEQELLGIHFGIKYFRPYVFGTKFIVKTDHKPLIYLYSLKDPTSKLARIRLDLSDYDFEIHHVKGSENVAADALSRLPISSLQNMHEENIGILAITTRSMTKNIVNIRPPITNKFITTPNNIEYKDAPSIKFSVTKVGVAESEVVCQLKTRHLSSTKTLLLNTVKKNKDVVLETLFNQLNSMASRRVISTVKINPNDDIFSIMSPSEFGVIANKHLEDLKIVLMQPIKVIELANERQKLMEHYHNHPLEGGHSGYRRTYSKLKSLYYWPNMSKDLSSFIKRCPSCQINKSKPTNKELLVITETPSAPFQSIIMDTIGPFPSTVNQYKYALTIICDFSKYLIIVPLPNKEAKTVAKAFLDNCLLTFGPVSCIRSDMGTEFVNSLMKELTELLAIRHDVSTPYHHETVGTCERSHKTLNEYLRTYTNNDPKSWHSFCKYFAYCFNTTPNTAINLYTPFELVFGKRVPPLLFKQECELETASCAEFLQKQQQHFKLAYERTRRFIAENKLAYKKYYDSRCSPINIKCGDEVLLVNEIRSKLDPLYKKGYIVVEVGDVNVVLRNMETNKLVTVHKNRIRKG